MMVGLLQYYDKDKCMLSAKPHLITVAVASVNQPCAAQVHYTPILDALYSMCVFLILLKLKITRENIF